MCVLPSRRDGGLRAVAMEFLFLVDGGRPTEKLGGGGLKSSGDERLVEVEPYQQRISAVGESLKRQELKCNTFSYNKTF